MKIIHVLTSLNIGGAERFVIDLAILQKKSNNEVKIISFGKKDEPLVEVCNDLKINIEFIHGKIMHRTKALNAVFKESDIIHFHSPHALKASIFSFPVLIKKKVIYTRHGAHPFNSGTWKFMHGIFQHVVNKVTFVSEDAHNVFMEHHNWKSVDSKTIENGIIMPDVESSKNKSDILKLGSVGRMVELKNQISLLRSINLLSKDKLDKVEVHFYGDGECMAELKDYARSKQLENIFFHGVVKDREVIYSNIDSLVVTSETEGLSLAIIEAMSYYKPTLASKVGGNPRLVIDDKTGHLFDYNDDDKLSKLIEGYIDSNSSLKEHGINARAHVEKTFSLDSTWKNYQKIY